MLKIRQYLIRATNGDPVVANAYLSYVQTFDAYIGQVMTLQGPSPVFVSKRPKKIEGQMEDWITTNRGAIIQRAPESGSKPVRVAQFPGTAALVRFYAGSPDVIQLDADDLDAMSKLSNGSELVGYLRRTLLPKLNGNALAILLAWLDDDESDWAYVPSDAQRILAHSLSNP